MAQLTRTAGQTLSLSEVRAFFDGKFDPAVAGVTEVPSVTTCGMAG